MKLLVLGGTKFLGRAVVDAALERGHEVTLFNRGQTNPELYPDVERLRGDRDGDLSALEGRSWDAVVDPSAYVPRVVRASAELLAPSVGHYVFVSSISVYRSFARPDFDEEAPLIELEDHSVEDVQEHYGGLKALCEQTVNELFPGRAANVRAGLIVGPHDPTDRFTYWPVRVARGGEVLAPAPPTRPVQFVDARDLGDWLVRLAEERTAGTFNATGPVPAVTFRELLDECRRVAASDATITWVEEDFLIEHGVGQWIELPLWLAQTDADWAHMQEADVARAVAAGLRFRPLAETIEATLAWHATRRDASPAGTQALPNAAVGLASDKEAALLREWRARAAAPAR